MFCPKCGAEVKVGAKFCPKCGSPIKTHSNSGKQDAEHSANRKPSSVAAAIAAVNKATHDTSKPGTKHARDAEASTQKVATPQVTAAPKFQTRGNGDAVLFVIDGILFVLATFVPWVGSYHTPQGEALSLPSLAIEGVKLLGQMGQYSSFAYQYGGGPVYEAAAGIVVLVALFAAAGWLIVIWSIYNDVKGDYFGQSSTGHGGRNLGILAIVVQLTVWFSVASVQSQLKGQYLDLSAAANGLVQTTAWVWLSMLVGFGASHFRKKVRSAGGESA